MDQEQVNFLKEQHQFDKWCGHNTLKENLFIWRYFISGRELPGWRVKAGHPLQRPDFPRLIQSMWQVSERDIETALRLDIYECTSRIDAHQFLLQLLSQFHVPGVERREGMHIGDVTFATPGNALILFARANLVLLLTNAGRKRVAIEEVAHPFDEDLIRKPTPAARVKTAAVKPSPAVPKTELKVGESVPVKIPTAVALKTAAAKAGAQAAPAAKKQPLCYKFFSSAGEVFLKEEEPHYKPESPGSQSLMVYEIYGEQDVQHHTLQFDAK